MPANLIFLAKKRARDSALPATGTIGRFELGVMLVLALLSFAGAPFYFTFVATLLLTASTLYEYAHLQPRFTTARTNRLLTGGVFLAAGTSLAFASLCFAIGRFFAWLIAG
jgi:hypothetical protein